MDQVWEFFAKLFDTSGFPPRWHCGRWTEFHGWFYIISDLLIWSAYFAIPVIILKYIYKKKNAQFPRLYFLFAAFILACGATHFLDAIIFWVPVYRLSALVRFITGLLSWATVFSLFRLLPMASTLKTTAQLQAEIDQRENAEEQLRINNQLLNEAQEIALIGHWQWDVKANKITWSNMTYKIYGMQPDENKELNYEEYISKIHPEDKPYMDGSIQKVFEDKKFHEYYHRILVDGEVKTVHSKGEVILNEEGEVIKMIGTVQDVTAQKKVEEELLSKTQALENSNVELEKFASIASHDLQEPLRKIITFSGMLESNYREVLGDKGKMYVDKITTASERMQKLINDILEFSRVTDTHSFGKTDLSLVIKQVTSDIEVLITNSGTTLEVGDLPIIEANFTQLCQLFQNLITNAIKFAKEGIPPRIKIHSEIIKGTGLSSHHLLAAQYYKFSILSDPRYWDNELFCNIYVTDNGIGFDESYIDKIFTLFQRLHSRTEYEGTGIGLAICKKVAFIHHGTITAHSKPGEGATFVITLPVSQKNFRNVTLYGG